MARLGLLLTKVFDGANRPQSGRVRPSKTMVEKGPHRGDAVTRRADA